MTLFGGTRKLTYCRGCQKFGIRIVRKNEPLDPPAATPHEDTQRRYAFLKERLGERPHTTMTREDMRFISGWSECAGCGSEDIYGWEPSMAVYHAVFGLEADYYKVKPGYQRIVGTAEQVFSACATIGKSPHAIYKTSAGSFGRDCYYVDIGPRHAKAFDALNDDKRLEAGA